jgi:hypothetical protein
MDLAKQHLYSKQPRQRRPGVRFEQTQTNSHVLSTKNRQSDAMVDDINGKPKIASKVR